MSTSEEIRHDCCLINNRKRHAPMPQGHHTRETHCKINEDGHPARAQLAGERAHSGSRMNATLPLPVRRFFVSVAANCLRISSNSERSAFIPFIVVVLARNRCPPRFVVEFVVPLRCIIILLPCVPRRTWEGWEHEHRGCFKITAQTPPPPPPPSPSIPHYHPTPLAVPALKT